MEISPDIEASRLLLGNGIQFAPFVMGRRQKTVETIEVRPADGLVSDLKEECSDGFSDITI